MSLFARHKLMSTRVRQSLLKVGVGVLAVSLALGGLAYADTSTPNPNPNNNTGGGGSTGGNQGSGGFTSQVVWATDDNFGPANDATVLSVLTNQLGGKAYKDTNTNIHTATENALNECINNYATRHNGDRNANCRVFGVGAVKSNDNTIANATGGHTQATWLTAWDKETANKTYSHNGATYNTSVPLNDGANTIDTLVDRETAGGNRSLVVIVLAQDQPRVKVIPDPPTKEIEQGISADRMRNTTKITTGTGVGGESLWFSDTINPNGLTYTVTDQSVWDLTTGQNISGSFTYNTPNGQTPAGNKATATWNANGGKLPDKHDWQYRLTV